jgi:hypothetical protein
MAMGEICQCLHDKKAVLSIRQQLQTMGQLSEELGERLILTVSGIQ